MTAEARPPEAPDQEADLLARIREGIRDADADCGAEAERTFLDVLAATRDGGTPVELLACAQLVKLYARQHRGVEGLLFARRRLVLAVALRDEENVCLAYADLADAFARIDDPARCDDALAALERRLVEHRGRFAVPLARRVARLRAGRALAHDDAVAAGAELSRIDALDPSTPESSEDARRTRLLHAELALLRGRPGAARAALARIGDAGPGGEDALHADFLALRCTLEIDGARAAAGAVGRMLDDLESSGAERHGTGARKRCARLLGDLVVESLDAPALARRAYDVAAAAVLLRATEIERAFRRTPEFARLDDDDALALADFRARFSARQRDLLAAVARLLRARVAAGDVPSWAQRTSRGVVDVCAWCLQVRLEDGVTLPIGHFLPHDFGLRVTHGICPPCRRRLTASQLPPAAAADGT